MKTIRATVACAILLLLCVGSTRIGAVQSTIANIHVACDVFRMDTGSYPTEEPGLKALLEDPGVKGWNGPYLTKLPTDPWKNQFRYQLADGKPMITSAGSDGKFGTTDDQDKNTKASRTTGCTRF